MPDSIKSAVAVLECDIATAKEHDTLFAFVKIDDLQSVLEALTTMQAREATLIRVLERAAENFERLTVPHIVGNDVHNFAFQAAKLIREALGTSGLVP